MFFERHEQGQGARHAVNNMLQIPAFSKSEFEHHAEELQEVYDGDFKSKFGLGYYDSRVVKHTLGLYNYDTTYVDLSFGLPDDFLDGSDTAGVIVAVKQKPGAQAPNTTGSRRRSSFAFHGIKKLFGIETIHTFTLRKFTLRKEMKLDGNVVSQNVTVSTKLDGGEIVWFELDSKKDLPERVGSTQEALAILKMLYRRVGHELSSMEVYRVTFLNNSTKRMTIYQPPKDDEGKGNDLDGLLDD
eukprot:GHVR01089245.1.p1 GENE.GHVR01089245.1~~GHVR01089245.1.p1  ORF type:complete len:243 (+),score=54.71 GHVR01089245.1:62-790(+)